MLLMAITVCRDGRFLFYFNKLLLVFRLSSNLAYDEGSHLHVGYPTPKPVPAFFSAKY